MFSWSGGEGMTEEALVAFLKGVRIGEEVLSTWWWWLNQEDVS